MRTGPKQQGDLDGLCGVYAVLNAVASLASVFGRDEQAKLFEQLIEAVYEQRKGQKREGGVCFVYRGVEPKDVGAMLDVASKFARKRLGFELTWKKGLPGRSANRKIQRFWQKIEEHLNKGPAIVVYNGPEEGESHWTCIVESKERVVRLRDSTGLKTLRKTGGTLGETVKGKRQFYWKAVFLLSRA